MADYTESTIVTPFVQLAVLLNRRAFFYLYPHLFEHHIDKNLGVFKISQAKWSWKLIPFILSILIFTTILGLGCCFYLCATHFLGIRTGRHRLELHIVLEIEFLAALGFLEVFSLITLVKKPLLMTCFNEIFHLERRCRTLSGLNEGNQSRDLNDLIGAFLILATVSFAFGGPFAIPLGLATRVDPFYYVAEEFLPDPHYRSMDLIVLVPIIRYIVSFFCVMEFLRIGVHGMFFISLSISALHSLLENLPKIESNVQSFRIFLQVRVFFATASELINSVALVSVIVGHVMTVLVLWATIMLTGIINPLVSLFFLCTSIFFLGLTVVVLRAPALFTYKTSTYIRGKRMMNPRLKYHQSIHIRCGPFFVFKHSTVMAYFNNIANNLTNAVLLVQP
ncbi:unnamed protein product [Orchesella dallaii]|uniref:Odorant receptor n=1 Tax=Orchesella dallaii TaxID=48710 RepID=A0ABP1S1P6_9HEXA